MALKDWKRSKHHARARTKIAWDSEKSGNQIAIDHIPSSNIPYEIMLNSRKIDSTGTLRKAMKIASNYRRKH